MLFVFCLTVPMFLIIAASIPAMKTPRSPTGELMVVALRFLFAPALLVSAVYWISMAIWHRRLVARVVALDYRACPNCTYSVRGLHFAEAGLMTCPECGYEFDIAVAAENWKALCAAQGGKAGAAANAEPKQSESERTDVS